jgi:pimeloyl-ACP methyl ester carboxylesterase
MASARALKIQDDKFSSLGFKTVVDKEQVVSYIRGLDSVSEKNPILVLVHGYPSSAYMYTNPTSRTISTILTKPRWRHLIPLLPSSAPIFCPDLPGYGASKALPQMDKLSVGRAILSSLSSQLPTSHDKQPVPIVLIGHDRGARISHRLTVSGHSGFNILGVCLIDIVPTCVQWHSATTASQAAKEVTGYFHWPFLANVELATRMISAYGGAKWCTDMISKWAGSNSTGLQKLESDDSFAVYGGFFENEDVIRASCEDYKHGATTDVVLQEEDQKEGRKIEKPLLLLYGKDFIGKRFDFGEVWKGWVKEGVEITDRGLENGIGHFGAEEAPEKCAEVIDEWMKGLGVGGARL